MAEQRPVGTYVSIQCPDGDVELDLRKDQTFVLEKKFWDDDAETHSKSIQFDGRWTEQDDVIELQIDGTKISYRYLEAGYALTVGDYEITPPCLEPLSEDWLPEVDRVDLLDRTEVDELFAKVMQAG
jgi:hypothetical protein